MPLDFSAPRYKGKPLLRLLDGYALAVIGQLSSEGETSIAAAADRAFGPTADWKAAVRRAAGLPEDMDGRIRELWDRQPPGTSSIGFVLAISDENFAPIIDKIPSSSDT